MSESKTLPVEDAKTVQRKIEKLLADLPREEGRRITAALQERFIVEVPVTAIKSLRKGDRVKVTGVSAGRKEASALLGTVSTIINEAGGRHVEVKTEGSDGLSFWFNWRNITKIVVLVPEENNNSQLTNGSGSH